MITDEQRKAFEQWAISSGLDFCLAVGNDGLYESIATSLAWDVWQAARLVKDVVFIKHPVISVKVAYTKFGVYAVCHDDTGFYFELESENVSDGTTYKTEAEAIAAANEDYQRRVLQCLLHGGE